MGAAMFDRFFDLPPEIREEILSYLTITPDPISLNPLTPEIPFPHALLLAHPLLRTAASSLYYTGNTFYLDLTTYPRASTERALVRPARNILVNAPARRRIRTLTLRPARLGTAFTASLLPALTDMILAGRLRHLAVALPRHNPAAVLLRRRRGPLPPPSQADRFDDAAFRASPAFRSLLRLLADPDLETAALRVPFEHRPLWCAFHDGAAPCCFRDAGAGARGLAEVDWRALAAECAGEDPELRIARVGDGMPP